MSKRLLFVAGVSLSALIMSVGQAQAAAADSGIGTVDEVVVVARDKAGLLEKAPSDSVFGLDKALIETPRSASFASDLTLQRYGVQSIDDLTAISPGTYTASFYGVPGALNIRGTLAENYFRGFKRIENRGTYSTPIGDAAQIEIVRGPPTPIYGSGKVGGMLNFVPKTGKAGDSYISEVGGEVEATIGSYDKKQFSGQIGIPLKLGQVDGGLHIYGEGEDSGSYYRGITPKRQILELSTDFDLNDGWTTALGAMFYHSDGDVQTPGWNRLTQDLINNQTYITGRDTSLVDADNNGKITPNEIGFYPYGTALYQAYYGFPSTDAHHTLDVGVGTTKLDPRTVYISKSDFSHTWTKTAYWDLAKSFDNGSALKLQLFYDSLVNKRFVSYGYPAWFDSNVGEARLTYNFDLNFSNDFIKTKSFVGASYRRFDGRRRESYNSGLIALDRRDISYGATATDIIDDPFSTESYGLLWENDNRSKWGQAGIFFTSDIYFGERLNLMVGGRYDNYDVKSKDSGFLSYQPSGLQKDGKSKGTYTASLSYKTDLGLMPYITYAQSSALEMSQAGDIAPSLVANGSWLSDSDLAEAGVKFQLLQGTLVGSVAGYRQNRTQLTSGPSPTIQGTRAKGVELEVRYLASEHLSFTFAGDLQHTEVKGPDTSFAYIPYYVAGVSPVNAFGGTYVVWNFNSLPGRSGDYAYTLIPHAVASLYGTYTSSDYSWGKVGGTFGATSVSKTAQTVQNPITYPEYTVASLSLFYEKGPFAATLNVDNLFDKLYFTPAADSYANLAALPGHGREWRLTLKRKF
ncbi:TonB-dependent siderophore receptor [Phenylobacterium aquaticum]|uniref:TonB-dependent siderophore receptor n=1 Tax=Phenylobacterium aquaticum TaxID=1763816 RepID=UPI001F5D5D1F|nr:TonB-dependent receptor [Phenylobacterium aquaticum]MCI3132389.1 TonB-dependent receptor [Phenylobacterium aquaticum]